MAFMSGEREVSLYMINPPLLQLLSNDLIIHVRKPNVVEYVTHCLGLRVPQGTGSLQMISTRTSSHLWKTGSQLISWPKMSGLDIRIFFKPWKSFGVRAPYIYMATPVTVRDSIKKLHISRHKYQVTILEHVGGWGRRGWLIIIIITTIMKSYKLTRKDHQLI